MRGLDEPGDKNYRKWTTRRGGDCLGSEGHACIELTRRKSGAISLFPMRTTGPVKVSHVSVAGRGGPIRSTQVSGTRRTPSRGTRQRGKRSRQVGISYLSYWNSEKDVDAVRFLRPLRK